MSNTPAPAPVTSAAPATPTVDSELETLIRARYPIIYVVSWEERRVEEALREICQKRGKKLLQWTATLGLAGNGATRDPLAALDAIINSPDQSVFLLKDFHPWIGDVVVTRKLRDLVQTLKTSYKTVIILSPVLKLPSELEKEITVVDYQLPTIADLDKLLEGIIQSVRTNPNINVNLTPLEREQVIKAASGLTSNEAENVFARSLVEKRRFDIDVILGEKEQIIRKSGILEYYPATEAFANVGGMDLLKEWMVQRNASFTDDARRYGLPEPKGILLLGVQGGGKSLTAKALASLWKLPLLRLDVGKIFAGIVGSSEENMRKAIATAESVAPCVAGDTRITLWGGAERQIAALWAGSETKLTVAGMNDAFEIVPVRVSAITRRAAPDLFTVKLRHATLQATSNHLHPVLRDGALVWTRTDALQAGDHVALPRQIPTAEASPRFAELLPSDTRVYAPDALAYARPDAQTPQRRYAARARGGTFVRIAELADPLVFPATITGYARGRGGTADTKLPRLPEMMDARVGYLLGLIDSDGYLGAKGRVGFVNTDKTLHARFADLVCELFGVSTQTRQLAPVSDSALDGVTPSSLFAPCFSTFADNRLLNTLLTAVREHVLTLPAATLCGYLRGYFDGDGCISDPATTADPKVTITCKKIVGNQRLRAVLHRAGFPTVNPGSANIEITGWGNVQRFIETIGSDHPCRRERMAAWQHRTPPGQPKDRTDPVPVGALLRQARNEIGMGSQHFTAASSGQIHGFETGKAHPSRVLLKRVVGEMQKRGTSASLDALAGLCDTQTRWTPVLSVTEAETPAFVYDLCCEGVHTFVANGLVTHNCLMWIDELEKGFAGTQSSGISDGGTTSRVFGTFLSWMQDKKAPVFVIATSNDVSALPPELMRKGRFDEIFFVDLPAPREREEIFRIHLKKRARDPEKFDIAKLAKISVGFSGAEIEQAVISALFASFRRRADDPNADMTTADVEAAVKVSVPLSVTMREGIAHLREWAETRARPVSSQQAEETDDILDDYDGIDDERDNETNDPAYFAADGPPAPVVHGSGDTSQVAPPADSATVESRLKALETKTATGTAPLLAAETLPNTPATIKKKKDAND